MQIQIDGQGLVVTPSLRDMAVKKLNRLTHTDKITRIHVTFKLDSETEKAANAIINLPGTTINAHAKSDDMYKTIDKLTDNLQTQLTKYKEKTIRYRDS